MKKITYPTIAIIILIFINACAGYKPIYTTDLQFRIADYSIKSNQKLGRKIYSKLYNLSKSSGNNAEVQNVYITVDTTKDKKATTKDGAGKILEYRIILNSKITIKDYLTNKVILNDNFSYSSSYTVQNQYSETKKLENKSIESLINTIYQNLIINMSENMLTQW